MTLNIPEITYIDCIDLVKNGDAELVKFTYWYHIEGGVDV